MSHSISNGRTLIDVEMARQHNDALVSMTSNREIADRIAHSIRSTGRLSLYGMGGSHWVNRTAAFIYRELGIEVQADVLSEIISVPMNDAPRSVIITSQSGGSGEIGKYLHHAKTLDHHFGLTLNADSILGKALPCLIAHGGAEKAFAATRSILLSQALHLCVLNELGYDANLAIAALKNPGSMNVDAAVALLAPCQSIVLTGRGVLQGVAESGALCLMELARMPTFALEGGQLRHGPMEMLSSQTGIVFIRPCGADSQLVPDLANACKKAGSKIVVLDLSGDPPLADCLTMVLPSGTGMAASFIALPAVQSLMVGIAATKVKALGIPLRSSKVTTAL